jgi:hypothetical protein
MTIEEIIKSLNIDKLDESVTTKVTEEIKKIIDEKVEFKVKEQVDEKVKTELESVLETEKEKLIEEYEDKFTDYKEKITEKFSFFIDDILKEKLEIPETIKEYARKGELYTDLIEQFKVRLAIDEGLISDEVKEILKEAKEEIIKTREEKNKLNDELLESKVLLKDASANIYLNEKCEGLLPNQKERVMKLLEGITDSEEIDKKFDIILEEFRNTNTNINEEMISIQVVDPKKSIDELKKVGVTAKINSKAKDEILVDSKDKSKIYK